MKREAGLIVSLSSQKRFVGSHGANMIWSRILGTEKKLTVKKK